MGESQRLYLVLSVGDEDDRHVRGLRETPKTPTSLSHNPKPSEQREEGPN